MILKTDFHIHSALSPCGDEDMTPNNIINMAIIKGLDTIAITDHNTAENAAVFMEVGKALGLTVIPGMELQTREEVHVICLFPTIEAVLEFQQIVYSKLPSLTNNERVFGEQLIFDNQDNIIGHNMRLLLTSVNMSLEESKNYVTQLGGAFIPAHIDKSANGIISTLGFIPENIGIKTLEYKSWEKVNNFIKCGMLDEKYKFIKSSDAHYLQDIQEEENKLECERNEITSILKVL